ncbi:MAG TPA: galactose oxidase early set domain-containing protein, partial [Candidatus Thermoplasmatota archaeon]|nr:galactose oxidase early set domain-containing protein [Candidatus Thermoplasmatota archaeon]
AQTLTWRDAAPMHVPRRDFSSVLLPTRRVLVVGGGAGVEAVPGWAEHAAAPEAYDATADRWTLLAPSSVHRGYHSTAILLPDGRVLASGGDFELGVGATPALAHTGEVFSPPELFRGPRPTISWTEPQWDLGAAKTVRTPDAASVAAVHLVRLSSVTHSLNTDQRVVPLAFERAGPSTLVARVPADAGAAPPGWYMLFLVSGEGVPSVARMVHVG